MPKKRQVTLTEARIRSLRSEVERYDIYDTSVPGLLIRVSPSGHKAFSVLHRTKDTRRLERVTVGSWPKVSLKRAREKAKVILGRFATGENPADDRRKVLSEQTLGELWTTFLKKHAKPRKRSWKTDERRYKKHLSQWENVRLSSITTERVSDLLMEITVKSGSGSANRVRALLFTMFEKGRKEWGLRLANPVRDTSRNSSSARDRYLQPDELRRFLRAVDNDHDATTRDYLRLALFTGQRRSTLCRARWEDINLRDEVWSIPASDMKAGKPLLLPLASAAVQMLSARRRAVGLSSPYVFPTRDPRKPIGARQKSLARVLKNASITGITLHDLRRTFATWAQDAGASLIVVSSLLGHTLPGGVTAVYARVHIDQLRKCVNDTVENMLRVAGTPDDGTIPKFPGTVRATA